VVEGPDERHDVSAGRQLVREVGGRVEISSCACSGESWFWVGETTPAFQLEGGTVRDYLRWFSRESGIEVVFEPDGLEPRVGDVRLHGRLPSMNPVATPQVVLPSCGLEGELRDGVLVVRRETPAR
jgi:hypothetical protein